MFLGVEMAPMPIDPSKLVRDLAVSVPGATRIFQEHCIDYCCRGARSLADACAAAGVAVNDLVAALEQATLRDAGSTAMEPRWERASVSDLVEHLVSHHHDHTRTELERLAGLADKVVAAHANEHPEVLDVRGQIAQLSDDLLPHMKKEEMVLFPYVAALARGASSNVPAPRGPFGSVRDPVRMMMREHEVTGALLRALRRASNDYAPPAGACPTWNALYAGLHSLELDLFQHIPSSPTCCSRAP
jgi:regulator of cell morphogenesis and NO signaling